jgi:secreted trypsin-like serine protease
VGRYDARGNGRDGAAGFTVVSQSRHSGFNDQVCCGYSEGNWFYGVFNDFLLLKLSSQSSQTLITLNSQDEVPVNNDELYVIGLGDVDPGSTFLPSERLREVTVNYMPNAVCVSSSAYPADLIDESSLCATDYREDACSGDSGGPLIKKGNAAVNDVQVGLVSWYVIQMKR